MSTFQLDFANRPSVQQTRVKKPQRVRIGAISIFALIIVICLAVLAVLSFSTANASLVMSQKQAEAELSRYLDETAAQEFVAGVDEALAGEGKPAERGPRAAVEALESELDRICADARSAAQGSVAVSASVQGNRLTAEFESGNGRVLRVSLSIAADATLRIEEWKMTAVQNEEPAQGQLLIVD